jgi:hypothetical protein
MSCKERCHFTAAVDEATGRRLMIKPSTNEVHPRCESCADEELAHAKLMVLFHNDGEMVKRYEDLQKKFG